MFTIAANCRWVKPNFVRYSRILFFFIIRLKMLDIVFDVW
nr:MAG TPA: hypothetical protein [Caudoviricetes sp.]